MVRRLENKLVLSLVVIVLIISTGTLGYMLIEGWSLHESLYMTVITLTTVGYGEVHPLSPAGQIFTMLLLIVGVGIILYLLSTEAKLLLEGHLQDYIGRSRLVKK